MIKVFLVNSGLGKVKRGFESFTQECFEALSKDNSIKLILFKGDKGAKGEKELRRAITLNNLQRDSLAAIRLGKIIGRGAYFIEQSSFTFSLLPYIYRQQPDLIYFSDGIVGNLLWHWRNSTKQSYKLLFSNGAPCFPPFLPHCDHVQQLTPYHLQAALDGGVSAAKQSLVSYGIKMPAELKIISTIEREALRCQLGLPQKRQIILSVGAINRSHKRMDYVVQETAALPEPRPYLLLLGQHDAESHEIYQLGTQLLGANNFQIKTVDFHQVIDYYKIADIFVLASLNEGFGRVFLEAMSYGLPCLAHDYEVTRFVLGKEGYFANFELMGSLTNLINKVLAEGNDKSKCYLRHRTVYNRFSWDKLLPSYVKMIQCVADQKM